MAYYKNITEERKTIFVLILILTLSVSAITLFSYINLKKNKNAAEIKTSEIIKQKYYEELTEKINNAADFTETLAKITVKEKNKNLDNTLSRLLTANKNATGIIIYLKKQNKKISDTLFNDTLKQFSALSIYKHNGKIITKYDELPGFNISKINNTGIYISEPFKITVNREKQNVLAFSKTLNQNSGFISVLYKTSRFTKFLSGKKCNYLLLSPEKNIISSSGNKINTGKNILNVRGKEAALYKETNNTKFKISPEKSTSEFYFIINCNSGKIFEKTNNLYAISAFLILLISIAIIYFYLKSTFKPLKNIKEKSKKISEGTANIINNGNLTGNFKEINENLNKIINYDKKLRNFAEEILKENFDVEINKRAPGDITTEKLNNITKYFKEKEQKRLEKEKKVSQQLWMRRGRFEISEAERAGSKDIAELSFNIIKSLVNYTGAVAGGLYLYNEETEEVELTAAYAYEKQRHLTGKFKKGEGLAGACISEKKKIILDKIPENYIKIATGLGSGTPSYIAVIPIFFKQKINAVIEIVFMTAPEEYIIEFIEQLSDNIGSWIDASVAGTKTAKLLEMSREQTKKLAEKEEELNKKVAELQEIQEKTAEINTKFKSILNAVNNTIMTVEYTLDGTIVSCNPVYTDIMEYKAEEIKGKNVADIVKDQSEDLKKIIEEVKAGKTIKKEVKRYTKSGKEKMLAATYTPYYDKNEKITHILFFAFDITGLKIK